MDGSLKHRYPFRLGTTSFIYPAGYASNVRRLAPWVDEIELLSLESSHLPDRNEIDSLTTLAREHGLTFNVHLPMDIDLASDSLMTRRRSIEAVTRTIDRVAPLHPTTHTLHLTCGLTGEEDESIARWQERAVESMTDLLNSAGIPAGDISVETLDYEPMWLLPIVEILDLAICADVGHIILHGFDLKKVLESLGVRTTMVHLHGVAAGKDHLSLVYLAQDYRDIMSSYLQDFGGSVSIEVFNLKRFRESLACFPEIMALAEIEKGP